MSTWLNVFCLSAAKPITILCSQIGLVSVQRQLNRARFDQDKFCIYIISNFRDIAVATAWVFVATPSLTAAFER